MSLEHIPKHVDVSRVIPDACIGSFAEWFNKHTPLDELTKRLLEAKKLPSARAIVIANDLVACANSLDGRKTYAWYAKSLLLMAASNCVMRAAPENSIPALELEEAQDYFAIIQAATVANLTLACKVPKSSFSARLYLLDEAIKEAKYGIKLAKNLPVDSQMTAYRAGIQAKDALARQPFTRIRDATKLWKEALGYSCALIICSTQEYLPRSVDYKTAKELFELVAELHGFSSKKERALFRGVCRVAQEGLGECLFSDKTRKVSQVNQKPTPEPLCVQQYA